MECGLSSLPYRLAKWWCDPMTLLLTWIVFFGVALSWWNRKRSESDLAGKAKSSVSARHFRDLPGPTGIPILGNIVQLGSQPHIVLAQWAEKYGPLFRLRMGFTDVLVVSGLQTIKEANKHPITFAGRPHSETSKLICDGLSLAFSNYSQAWRKQRSSAAQAMSYYTTGKDSTKRTLMENSANHHAQKLVDQLLAHASHETGLVEPKQHVLLSGLKVISTVCFGRTFELGDPLFTEFATITKDFDGAMGAAQPVNFWPILKYAPVVGRAYRNLKIYADSYWKFIISLLENHWSSYDSENLRDIVDCLKYEGEKVANKSAQSKSMIVKDAVGSEAIMNGAEDFETAVGFDKNANNLKSVPGSSTDSEELKRRISYAAGDIFGAGYDTLNTAISWMIFYMAVYPDTQQKLREDIDRVMAPDEQPSLRFHGRRATYTQAWIYEMLRHASFVPMLIPHATVQATELKGCHVPAGITVFFNCWQTTRDKDVWDEPEKFMPERFLKKKEDTDEWTLRSDAVSNLLSWGVGTRRCLGEQLSRHQLFIFASTIVRCCYIEPAEAGVEPKLPWPCTSTLTIKPEPYRVKITAR